MTPQGAVERFLTAFYTGNIPQILESVVPQFTMEVRSPPRTMPVSSSNCPAPCSPMSAASGSRGP
jgi:hypothetical protein